MALLEGQLRHALHAHDGAAVATRTAALARCDTMRSATIAFVVVNIMQYVWTGVALI